MTSAECWVLGSESRVPAGKSSTTEPSVRNPTPSFPHASYEKPSRHAAENRHPGYVSGFRPKACRNDGVVFAGSQAPAWEPAKSDPLAVIKHSRVGAERRDLLGSSSRSHTRDNGWPVPDSKKQGVGPPRSSPARAADTCSQSPPGIQPQTR